MSRADINLIINCSSPRPRSIRRSIERSGRLTPCSSTSSASARRSGTSRPQRALRARFGSRNREPLGHQAAERQHQPLTQGRTLPCGLQSLLASRRANQSQTRSPERLLNRLNRLVGLLDRLLDPLDRRLDLHRLSLGRDRIARKQVPVRVKQVT
jgi:hypothetical protein